MLFEKRNFLNTTEFQNSFGFLNGDMAFPWFYSKNTAYGMAEDNHQLWDFSFSHVVAVDGQGDSPLTEKSMLLAENICSSFDLGSLEVTRIRLGMMTKTPRPYTHNPHVDYPFPHLTALFYLTTCNGPTVLYDQKFPNDSFLKTQQLVQSEENKVVIFDGLQYHASTTQTDKKQRIVMNINFKVK
jgi:hypothetical protein